MLLNLFKVNNKDTRTTTLAFRIFGSIRYHKVQCLFFFSYQIILQPKTVKLIVTKSYVLVDVVGVLALV